MRIFLAIGLVLLLLSGAGYWFVTKTEQDGRFYAQLKDETDTYIEAAYVPGAANNPVRGELNRMLGEVLSVEMGDADRLERAERGLFLLSELELQIDAIGATKDTLQTTLSGLENDLVFVPEALEGERGDIGDIMDRLYVIVDDIRGLSYRANYHTERIFERIVADSGSLTAEHVLDLNEEVPEVEKQFDRRSNLYTELEDLDKEIDALYTSLEQSSAHSRFLGIFR